MNKYVLHITKGLIISLKDLINYEGDIIIIEKCYHHL